MAINDGGYWYPSLISYAHAADRGATVRDVFAAHALAGLVAANPSVISPAMIAEKAYTVADALVAKRARDYTPTGVEP